MSTQLRKVCLQLAFGTKKNYCRFPQLPYLVAQQRIQICERKLSALCTLPASRTNENSFVDENVVDEFDEEFIYEYPANIPQQTQPLIREVMEEAEIRSRFHFREIPKNLSPENWSKLLLVDRQERQRYYNFLYWAEKSKELRKKRAFDMKQIRVPKFSTRPKYDTCDVVPYFHTRNSLFCFTCLKHLMKRKELLVMKSAIFGPHVIIDCSYDSYMVDSELTSCVRQLAMLRKDNKEFLQPFNIIHCNVNLNGRLIEKLKTEFIPDCLDPANTFNYTEKNFTDLFPIEKLVYLSPHSDIELETYDHDAVYVVGALVDHTPKTGLSVEKAHLSGIKTAKFPLDRYINWCQGTQCLMLVQAVNIIHDLKVGYSWDEILREHIRNEKTTHAAPYWNAKRTHQKPLSSSYIEHLNNKDYYRKNKEVNT